ncbi:MAG: flavin reductase family protein [Pseudomonadota bacterium]
MSVDAQLELRKAFGTFMTGVTVVTTYTPEGLPVGFTANSFTSVSLEPPLVLVCPSNALTSLDAFLQCDHFAVNILAENQEDVSNVFARPIEDRFGQVAWHHDAYGSPLFAGVSASFSCSVHERMPAGDHQLLLGRVRAFEVHDRPGLGYANGGYFSLGLERLAAEMPRASRAWHVGAIIEHDGKVLLMRTESGLQPPSLEVQHRAGSLVLLRDHLRAAEIDVKFGPVYSVFENRTGEYFTFYRGMAQSSTSGAGEYIAIDNLDDVTFSTPAIGDMMKRWRLERQHGVFRLYVGDEIEGDVHAVNVGNANGGEGL